MEEPTRLFRLQHEYREEHKRIQRAMRSDAIDASAEEIAEQVHGERTLPPRNMRGLAREEAHKINDATAREIASLRSQLEKLRADLGGEPPASRRSRTRADKNKNKTRNKNPSANASDNKRSKKKRGGGGKTNEDFRRSRGKAAGKGAATQPRGRAAGSGSATSGGKGKPNKSRSHSKSAGRKRASGTGKRN